MSNCQKCNASSIPGDDYCRQCGNNLKVNAQGQNTYRTSNGNNFGQKFGGIVASLVAGVALIGGRALFHSHLVQQSIGSASSSAGDSQGSHLRRFQAGDSWTYRVSMTMTAPDGHSLTCNGTMTEHISAAILGDQKILCDITNFDVTLPNGKSINEPQRVFFVQDASGNQVEIGDYGGPNDTYRSVSPPVIIWPGQFSDNMSLNCNLNFSNGEKETGSITATGGAINKMLPDGSTVVCWPTAESSEDADGKQTSTSIYAPGLGSFVDTTVKAVRHDGLVIQYNLTLTSTNVKVGV